MMVLPAWSPLARLTRPSDACASGESLTSACREPVQNLAKNDCIAGLFGFPFCSGRAWPFTGIAGPLRRSGRQPPSTRPSLPARCRASVMIVLDLFLHRLIRQGTLTLIDETGRIRRFGSGEPRVTARIHDRRTGLKLFLNPEYE